MSYSRNFGFRSFENIVRDGRFRTPTSGSPLIIGTPVEVDPANPGFLKQATAGAAPSPGCGVLVYEHITVAGLGGFNGIDLALTSPNDAPFNQVPLGKYAQLVHGNGTKIWLRNAPDRPLYDGRVVDSPIILQGMGATPTISVGDYLTPNGDGSWRVAAGGDGQWLYVEQVDATSGRVEARFAF